MARYTVIPTDRSEPVTRISARDGCAIVELVSRIRCKSADVFEGGRYKYSLRIEPTGMWCIFQRKHECVPLELVRDANSAQVRDEAGLSVRVSLALSRTD